MTSQLSFLSRPPRKKPRVLMKMTDAGDAGYMLPEWTTSHGACFQCPKCGHKDGWTFNLMVAQVKRGLPCPECNK